jgi:hypothetical protein
MGNQGGHVKGNDPQRAKRLLDLAKEILRYKRYSIRTEEAYIGVYTFLMHWRENTQMRTGNGDGNRCFLQKVYQKTLVPEKSGGITSMRILYKKR